MANTNKLTVSIRDKLNMLIDTENVKTVFDIKLNKNSACRIIYPTDDLWLNSNQLNVLFNLNNCNHSLNLLQEGDTGKLFSDGSDVFAFTKNEIQDYLDYNLYSICAIFPDNCEWICLIDETFDAGMGVLIGNDTIISAFNSLYCSSEETDLLNLKSDGLPNFNSLAERITKIRRDDTE